MSGHDVETTEILPAPAGENGSEGGDGTLSHLTEQVGAASFSDLVRAHFSREHERAKNGRASKDAEDEYDAKLRRFEKEEGRLGSIYWSTRNASAVALTIGKAKHARNPFAETDIDVRLHRVTDWVTKNAEPIAVLLHECDVLAIRVREILRGTSQRIALQWIYSIQEHALGFIERSERRSTAREDEMIASQRQELARIEKYYLRTGSKAGRIVYVSGMLVGASVLVALSTGAGFLIRYAWNPKPSHNDWKFLVLCTGAGAVGALVSVLSRMSGGDDASFSVDFEVGRPMLRRLGLYKPLVGSVFGVATYFLLAAGLLQTTTKGSVMYFYGILAFLAGFSERFTGVIFGNAERLVGGQSAAPPPPQQGSDSTTK
jgi:hypothetical protein